MTRSKTCHSAKKDYIQNLKLKFRKQLNIINKQRLLNIDPKTVTDCSTNSRPTPQDSLLQYSTVYLSPSRQ